MVLFMETYIDPKTFKKRTRTKKIEFDGTKDYKNYEVDFLQWKSSVQNYKNKEQE